MAGHDGARGYNFQHSYATLELVTRAVAAASGWEATVESRLDIVDLEIRVDGRVEQAIQIKTRGEGRSWSAKDIEALEKSWVNAGPQDGQATFVFATDGQLSTGALESVETLHINVKSRLPSAEIQLKMAELTLINAGVLDAEDRVNSLFVEVSRRSGKTDPNERVFTAEEVADRCLAGGADFATRRAATENQLRAAQRIYEEVLDESVGRSELIASIAGKLQKRDNIHLWGAPGFGKTTVARAVQARFESEARRVVWVEAGVGKPAEQILDEIASAARSEEVGPLGGVVSQLANLEPALEDVDLLIVDDLWDDRVLRTIASISDRISVLSTSGDASVGVDPGGSIEIPILPQSAVLGAFESLGVTSKTAGLLAEGIDGWCLLFHLVVQAIKVADRSGLSVEETAATFQTRLVGEGPTAFDSSAGSRHNAVAAAVSVSLDQMTDIDRSRILRLGATVDGARLEFPDLKTIWGCQEQEALLSFMRLKSFGLVSGRGGLSGEVRIHGGLQRVLSERVDDETAGEVDSLIAASYSAHQVTSRYVAGWGLVHLQRLSGLNAALDEILSGAWQSAALEWFETEMDVRRQELLVVREMAEQAGASISTSIDVILLALIERALVTRLATSVRMVDFLLALRGPEFVTSIVELLPTRAGRVRTEVALAVLYKRNGDSESARLAAGRALDVTLELSHLDSLHSVLPALERLVAVDLVAPATVVEKLDSFIGRLPNDVQSYARATTANELLGASEEVARATVAPLVQQLQDGARSGRDLRELLGEFADDVLRVLLPVLGLVDYDLGLWVEEMAEDDFLIAHDMEIWGGLTAGRILADPVAAFEAGLIQQLPPRAEATPILAQCVRRALREDRRDVVDSLIDADPSWHGRVLLLQQLAREELVLDARDQYMSRLVREVQSSPSRQALVWASSRLLEIVEEVDIAWLRHIVTQLLAAPEQLLRGIEDIPSATRILAAAARSLGEPELVELGVIELADSLTGSSRLEGLGMATEFSRVLDSLEERALLSRDFALARQTREFPLRRMRSTESCSRLYREATAELSDGYERASLTRYLLEDAHLASPSANLGMSDSRSILLSKLLQVRAVAPDQLKEYLGVSFTGVAGGVALDLLRHGYDSLCEEVLSLEEDSAFRARFRAEVDAGRLALGGALEDGLRAWGLVRRASWQPGRGLGVSEPLDPSFELHPRSHRLPFVRILLSAGREEIADLLRSAPDPVLFADVLHLSDCLSSNTVVELGGKLLRAWESTDQVDHDDLPWIEELPYVVWSDPEIRDELYLLTISRVKAAGVTPLSMLRLTDRLLEADATSSLSLGPTVLKNLAVMLGSCASFAEEYQAVLELRVAARLQLVRQEVEPVRPVDPLVQLELLTLDGEEWSEAMAGRLETLLAELADGGREHLVRDVLARYCAVASPSALRVVASSPVLGSLASGVESCVRIFSAPLAAASDSAECSDVLRGFAEVGRLLNPDGPWEAKSQQR